MKYVLHLDQWKVLICLHDRCNYALVPQGISRHLKKHHGEHYDLQLRREIVSYSEGVALVSPSEIDTPVDVPPPIEGLRIMDGWRCKNCSKVGQAIGGGVEHCRKAHGQAKGYINMY